MDYDELKQLIIDLYQNIKIRKESDTKVIDKEFLEKEKQSLIPMSPKLLIDYIKTNINLLIDIKVNEIITNSNKNPMEFISYYGSEIPANDYEKLLRRYEGDIRNYIRMINILKIHIDELNQKQELLEKQIGQFQRESMELIPTNKSLEYKKKIEELTSLVKSYEKHNLKIPYLEKKIKIQKIELDKLDSYYKKQIKSFTKKLEDYEKGIYLNKNNDIVNKIKLYKPNYNTSLTKNKKMRNRINSISPPKENKTLSCLRYDDIKNKEEKSIKKLKKNNSSIKTIFLYSKNNKSNESNNEDISINININNNINNRKSVKFLENKKKNLYSPKFGDKKTIDNYYDSIETDTVDKKFHKTINVGGITAMNFRKKNYIKSNDNIKSVLYKKNNNNNIDTKYNNIFNKIKPKSNSKKGIKKINSNKSILKIPKNVPDHINTSKYICIRGKNIPNLNRYNSLKQMINNKNRIKINSNKENEQFNKTYSKITNNESINTNTRSSTNNNNNNNNENNIKNKKIFIKINKSNNPMIINGRTSIPIKKNQSKIQSFIK
jgi:hypothetical protein